MKTMKQINDLTVRNYTASEIAEIVKGENF